LLCSEDAIVFEQHISISVLCFYHSKTTWTGVQFVSLLCSEDAIVFEQHISISVLCFYHSKTTWTGVQFVSLLCSEDAIVFGVSIVCTIAEIIPHGDLYSITVFETFQNGFLPFFQILVPLCMMFPSGIVKRCVAADILR